MTLIKSNIKLDLNELEVLLVREEHKQLVVLFILNFWNHTSSNK